MHIYRFKKIIFSIQSAFTCGFTYKNFVKTQIHRHHKKRFLFSVRSRVLSNYNSVKMKVHWLCKKIGSLPCLFKCVFSCWIFQKIKIPRLYKKMALLQCEIAHVLSTYRLKKYISTNITKMSSTQCVFVCVISNENFVKT